MMRLLSDGRRWPGWSCCGRARRLPPGDCPARGHGRRPAPAATRSATAVGTSSRVPPGKDAAVDAPRAGRPRRPTHADARGASARRRRLPFQHPQVILALDRSASMQERPASGGSSRLQGVQARAGDPDPAVPARCTSGTSSSRWPTARRARCCASRVVTPGKETLSAIQRRWSCELRAGQLPEHHQGLAGGRGADGQPPRLRRPAATTFDQRHVFLLTDGEPSCAASASSDDQCMTGPARRPSG